MLGGGNGGHHKWDLQLPAVRPSWLRRAFVSKSIIGVDGLSWRCILGPASLVWWPSGWTGGGAGCLEGYGGSVRVEMAMHLYRESRTK